VQQTLLQSGKAMTVKNAARQLGVQQTLLQSGKAMSTDEREPNMPFSSA
jgi:hypothetical protein